jgi:hypothetical protein
MERSNFKPIANTEASITAKKVFVHKSIQEENLSIMFSKFNSNSPKTKKKFKNKFIVMKAGLLSNISVILFPDLTCSLHRK